MPDATCTCGAVRIEIAGDPVMVVECGCTSCQTAGQAFGGVLTELKKTGCGWQRAKANSWPFV